MRFLVFLVIVATVVDTVNAQEYRPEAFVKGNPLCPCLPAEEMAVIEASDLNNTDTVAYLGDTSDLSLYGVGCGQHDRASAECSNPACAGEENVIPKSLDCDRNYCNLNFCYVDPNNCQLLNRRSMLFPNTYRYYSYATCWDVDSFTSSARISALEGRIFRVGFNSNSGGWQGAYSKQRHQFQGPVDLWTGPTVDFAVTGFCPGENALSAHLFIVLIHLTSIQFECYFYFKNVCD